MELIFSIVIVMLAKIRSGAIVGLTAVPVTVEVDIASQGLPSFTIVGLPDKAVDESRERVRAALKNSGAEFPAKRITVNLAPADLPKAGPLYDLPIALGILVASGQLPVVDLSALYLGELSLDGSIKHTNGVLPLVLLAKEEKLKSAFIPAPNAQEAGILTNITIYPVATLLELFHHFAIDRKIVPVEHISFDLLPRSALFGFDMADIQGQESAKRMLEIAAAGNHNVFFCGQPGAGKTLLARTLPSIMPTLTEDEAIEVTKIYSVTGNLPPNTALMTHRPFRSPHHTTSRIGLIGGGSHPLPGEISLAHRGVLFLDEFPEFPRSVLEALRQPLEDGAVHISRAASSVVYPCQFLLIAASNPCPCGNYGSVTKRCSCMPGARIRYKKRISGPLIDRIDLHLTIQAVESAKLVRNHAPAESSAVIQARVQAARLIQEQRFASLHIHANGDMSSKLVKQFCPLSAPSLSLLETATTRLNLSARVFYRLVKIARTIADLEGAPDILPTHIAEALQYRPEEE